MMQMRLEVSIPKRKLTLENLSKYFEQFGKGIQLVEQKSTQPKNVQFYFLYSACQESASQLLLFEHSIGNVDIRVKLLFEQTNSRFLFKVMDRIKEERQYMVKVKHISEDVDSQDIIRNLENFGKVSHFHRLKTQDGTQGQVLFAKMDSKQSKSEIVRQKYISHKNNSFIVYSLRNLDFKTPKIIPKAHFHSRRDYVQHVGGGVAQRSGRILYKQGGTYYKGETGPLSKRLLNEIQMRHNSNLDDLLGLNLVSGPESTPVIQNRAGPNLLESLGCQKTSQQATIFFQKMTIQEVKRAAVNYFL